MPDAPIRSASSETVEANAAQWLARRDRGLSASEQADYQQWLGEDGRHDAAIARLDRVWRALDRVAERLPAADAPSNPDFLAGAHRRSRWVAWSPLMAAAAAVPLIAAAMAGAVIYFSGAPPAKPTERGQVTVQPGPERRTLEDGSIVELNTQAMVEVQFTATERRVRLVRGEAFFTVAQNPARPFIVSTPQVTVRAVGTAFSVALAAQQISVLVTEGRVQVADAAGPAGETSLAPRELSALVAGEQGILNPTDLIRGDQRWEMTVLQLSPAQIDRALAWQGLRLEFVDLPLADVVAAFNRYNRKKLVIHDPETAAILVGGNFRADNVDAFVRLLEVGRFGVAAFPHGEEIILRKTRAQ